MGYVLLIFPILSIENEMKWKPCHPLYKKYIYSYVSILAQAHYFTKSNENYQGHS